MALTQEFHCHYHELAQFKNRKYPYGNFITDNSYVNYFYNNSHYTFFKNYSIEISSYNIFFTLLNFAP